VTTAAPRFDYMTYDGSNGTDVVTFANAHCTQPVALASESGGVLTLNCQDDAGNPTQVTFNTWDLVCIPATAWWPSAYSQAWIDANYVTVVP
jgi:hypothetical protein